MRPSWDKYFINIAEVVSTRSHDAETKVGCVIVDANNRVISTGYNGFPPGCEDNNLPNTRPDKYLYMLHAEINAIATCRTDLKNSTIYITISCCQDCAKAITAAGISRVVFGKVYKNSDFEFTKKFLKQVGVKVDEFVE